MTLHVTNGESAASTLRITALGGAVVSWMDVLHDGPVPALPPGELAEVRARFFHECGWGSERVILEEFRQRDELLEQAGQVVLWFEHDLYDQLQLVQILQRVSDPERAELICIDSFPGRPGFRGLGELEATELESLWPERRPVIGEDVALAGSAWDALCASDPLALESLAARDTAALPFLGAALRRLLEELPAVRSGLSRSECQALELLVEEPRSPLQLFLAAQEREEAPFGGDAWFYRCVAGLGELIVRPGNELEVTDAGRAVVAGDADRVELLGLDRWLGGTHLTAEDHWRWDGARVVRAPG